MSTNPGSWLTATGYAFLLLGVSAGVGSGELGLLLGLAGVLVGASFLAAGARRMSAVPTTPTGPAPAAPAVLGALTAILRRNVDVVGLILSSSAITAVAGCEAGPVLSFAMFALFLIGLCLINIHVLGREE